MHTAMRILERGDVVVRLSNLNDFYDPVLKVGHLDVLAKYPGFRFIKGDLVDCDLMSNIFVTNKIVIH